jgi:hypothetical protein
MAPRTGLHDLLSGILASFGVWLWDTLDFDADNLEAEIIEEAGRHVYYQPPENFKMVYPCIVYERSRISTLFADSKPYVNHKQYTVTVIDKNADSLISDKIAKLPMCRFDRHFTSDRLHHDVFNIYY